MTPEERASAIETKIAAFFDAGKSWSWTTNGVMFTLSGFSRVGGYVEVTVSASDANGPLPTNNPYRFMNPPTAVYGPSGNLKPNSTLEAAKVMVEQTVLQVARAHGWGG